MELPSHVTEFPFQKFQYVWKNMIYCIREKADIFILNVIINSDVKPFYKLDIKNSTLPSYESP